MIGVMIRCHDDEMSRAGEMCERAGNDEGRLLHMTASTSVRRGWQHLAGLFKVQHTANLTVAARPHGGTKGSPGGAQRAVPVGHKGCGVDLTQWV